jgi:hypothetical protein
MICSLTDGHTEKPGRCPMTSAFTECLIFINIRTDFADVHDPALFGLEAVLTPWS